jgi:hypothetical protein
MRNLRRWRQERDGRKERDGWMKGLGVGIWKWWKNEKVRSKRGKKFKLRWKKEVERWKNEIEELERWTKDRCEMERWKN